MIESLHIENIAVIRRLDVEFSSGFTVLSGETGAGKSILIDSLNLLLGARADRELIRTGEEKAVVSAVFCGLPENVRTLLREFGFDDTEDKIMLSRTVTPATSSARLNGRGITLSVLREIAGGLFNIHGQNDNQQLLDPKNHIRLLDAYAGCAEKKGEYAALYREVLHLRAELDSLEQDAREQTRMCEMLRYQIQDIDRVKPKAGEEEALEELAAKLRNVEKIEKCRALSEKALQGGERGMGAIYLTERAAGALASIADAVPEAEALSERLNDIRYELEDIAAGLAGLADFGEEDPVARLDRAEERLDAIARLKKKYGGTVEEILAFRRQAEERLAGYENMDDRRADLEEELKEKTGAARRVAQTLSEMRRRAAVGLRTAVTGTLAFLDMPKVRFDVGIRHSADLNANGEDEVEFLIATNPGEEPAPLARIASGGELARIMLSLKNVLNACDGVQTVIFDEIDTGISGKTSRKVGIKLKEIGKNTQVICVTHSAQIASLANHHFFIAKRETDGRAETVLTPLEEEARVGEIARILGGIEITDVQRAAAREMIAEGEQYS